MSLVLNLLWVLLGGGILALGWWLAGLLFALSIIGLPWAAAAFRLGLYALWPFGSEQVDRRLMTGQDDSGTGAFGAILNLVWVLIAGWWLALAHLIEALLWAITIIGLPFAYAHVKLAGAALFPIGKMVVRKRGEGPYRSYPAR